MSMQTNIDDVRAEIMRLESAPHFDADAWSRVLADLSTAGRFSALADATRRMETARSNQPAVAVETGYNAFSCSMCRLDKIKPEYRIGIKSKVEA